jgi:hypothetical protein
MQSTYNPLLLEADPCGSVLDQKNLPTPILYPPKNLFKTRDKCIFDSYDLKFLQIAYLNIKSDLSLIRVIKKKKKKKKKKIKSVLLLEKLTESVNVQYHSTNNRTAKTAYTLTNRILSISSEVSRLRALFYRCYCYCLSSQFLWSLLFKALSICCVVSE